MWILNNVCDAPHDPFDSWYNCSQKMWNHIKSNAIVPSIVWHYYNLFGATSVVLPIDNEWQLANVLLPYYLVSQSKHKTMFATKQYLPDKSTMFTVNELMNESMSHYCWMTRNRPQHARTREDAYTSGKAEHSSDFTLYQYKCRHSILSPWNQRVKRISHTNWLYSGIAEMVHLWIYACNCSKPFILLSAPSLLQIGDSCMSLTFLNVDRCHKYDLCLSI